jgi:hypothetical protein
VLPLVVALVALSLAIWGRVHQSRTTREIQQSVQQMCRDLAAGRDLNNAVNPDDAFAEQRTIEQLRAVCADAADASRIDVQVIDAKSAPVNSMDDRAHAVMLRLDGIDRLGLIVRHDRDPAAIRITGYWNPAAVNPP